MDSATNPPIFIYVGTYAKEQSEGIYVYRMNPSTGDLEFVSAASGLQNPSFLALHPRLTSLYAVNEVGDSGGEPGGAVSVFSINRSTGALTPLNRQSSKGSGPCHVSVDATGEYVLVANYGSGSIAMLPVHEDGSLGEATDFVQHVGSSVNPGRQEGPHAHSIFPDPTNRYALSADLGLDKLMVYQMDLAEGQLRPNDPPWAAFAPGAGPRHFTFSPNGQFVYAITELANTVVAFEYDGSRGALREIQTISTLPDDFTGTSYCAEIQASPSGRFLYGSNRGHDSLAIFEIDEATGRLTARGHEPTGGKNPRNFTLDPTGTFLYAANQDTDNVVVFRVDPGTGSLSPTGHVIELPRPVCVKILSG